MMSPGIRTILVIEDDEAIMFGVTAILEAEGYLVRRAGDGRAALEFLQDSPMPDLILLDMVLPVMDGWQFASKLKGQFERTPPIVVMTAASDAEKRAKDIDAAGWIAKPFDLNNLLEEIKKHGSK